MKINMLTRVRSHFKPVWNSPIEVTRYNQRAWVRSVRALGDKWLLAQPVIKGE